MKCGSFFITIFLLLHPVSVGATPIQDLNSIRLAAENYAKAKILNKSNSGQRTEVVVGKIDPRLRLSSCASKLIAFSPPGSRLQGNTTVGLRCDSPKPWSIYVAVKIAIFEQVIVSTGKMNRGQVIGLNDIVLDEVDISRVRGRAFTSKNSIIGTKLKIALKANQVIDSNTICLICKGDPVLIKASASSISVTMAGIALNDGSKGDKIRVQNNASRRIVDAIVTESGTVTVDI